MPSSHCAAVLTEGEPRQMEKVLFLCHKEEKLQKGGKPMPSFALNSRVGRRVASPHPRPLCIAEGIIFPHFPTFFADQTHH